MKRWLVYFCVALAIFGCGASARQTEAVIADGIASGANSSLPMLLEAYKVEGEAVIAKASTREIAADGLQAVRVRWAPVWHAWKGFRIAHAAWATALEAGGDTAAVLESLKKAYCEVEHVWPEELPVLPSVPITCPAAPAPEAPLEPGAPST